MMILLMILNVLLLNTGDIIFQDSKQSDFTDAIKNVTKDTSNNSKYSFSHCGIIVRNTDSTVFVIEATTPSGVIMTSIDSFIAKGSKIKVARLSDSLQYIIPNAINRAQKLLGKEYDYKFDFTNDAYYCSELIYFTYLDKNGNPVFDSNAMTFISPATNKTDTNWIKYFDKLEVAIPEGKAGCNPNGLFKSQFLKIIH